MTVFIDGKALAREIETELAEQIRHLPVSPRLAIIIVGDNSVTESFVAVKKRFAEAIGVAWIEKRFPENVTTETLIASIQDVAPHADGIVVQLPLPQQVDTTAVLEAVPPTMDIDVLSDTAFDAFRSETSDFVPPVAGAIIRMLEAYDIAIHAVPVTVIGKGRLVGLPTKILLERLGANVRVVDTQTPQTLRSQLLNDADIIISGTGVPGLLQPDMIHDDVVLIDAGTSSARGAVVGDIDPDCFVRASLVAKTPGGVGPATVAMLFKNLVSAVRSKCA